MSKKINKRKTPSKKRGSPAKRQSEPISNGTKPVSSRPFMTSQDVSKLTKQDRPIDTDDKTVQEILRRYYGSDWGIDEITKCLVAGSAETNSRFSDDNRRVKEPNAKFESFKRFVLRVIQTVPKEAIKAHKGATYMPPNCAPMRRYEPYEECDD